jgi:hypothetical protein
VLVAVVALLSLGAVPAASAREAPPPAGSANNGQTVPTLDPGLDVDVATSGLAVADPGASPDALRPSAALITGTTLNGGQTTLRPGTTDNVMTVHGSEFLPGTTFQFTPAFNQAGSVTIKGEPVLAGNEATITFDVSADATQWFAFWTREPGDLTWTLVMLLQVYNGKGLYFPLPTPARLADNRNGIGGLASPLGPDETWHIPIAGQAGIPARATAVSLNVTAIGGAIGGWLSLYPAGGERPLVSAVNFGPGDVVPNHVIVPLGPDGGLELFNGSGDAISALVDIDGYYSGEDVPGGLMYMDAAPLRVVDMRSSGVTIPAGQTATLPMTYGNGRLLPQGYVADVNVTVTNQTGAGWASVYGGGTPLPPTSTHNWTAPSQDTANRIAVAIGPGGAVNITNGSNGSIQVVMDLFGTYNPVIGYRFTPITPKRVVDTRGSNALSSDASQKLDTSSWVSPEPHAFVGNLTADEPTSATYLQLWAGSSSSLPPVSNVNLQAGQTRANGFIATASSNTLNVHNAFGSANAIIDIFGTFDL